MEINIPLPESNAPSSYKELLGYLKQLELAIHHAQKSVESAEQSGINITEDCYVHFDHPLLRQALESWVKEESEEVQRAFKGLDEDLWEDLQSVELSMNIQ